MRGVYSPAEDSLLLQKHLELLVHGSVMDMGTGSGILAVSSASKPEVERVVAVDINPSAIRQAKARSTEERLSHKIDFLVCDLFSGLDSGWFDWIVFNPPYLPSEGDYSEVAWSGGQRGGETLDRFLAAAADHLKPYGCILTVVSSLTSLELDRVKEKYFVQVLEEKKLFFERLYCLLLRPC